MLVDLKAAEAPTAGCWMVAYASVEDAKEAKRISKVSSIADPMGCYKIVEVLNKKFWLANFQYFSKRGMQGVMLRKLSRTTTFIALEFLGGDEEIDVTRLMSPPEK